MIGQITNYIKETFRKDSMVKTLEVTTSEVVDVAKENLYPLVSIYFVDRNRNDDKTLLLYNFRIKILQKRDVKASMTPSKTLEDINLTDNLNDTENIANNFINYIERLDIDSNINVDSLNAIKPYYNSAGSGLDGVQFDVVLSYPNVGYCNY